MACPDCGSKETIKDSGQLFCKKCGLELDDFIEIPQGKGKPKVIDIPNIFFKFDPKQELYILKIGIGKNLLIDDWQKGRSQRLIEGLKSRSEIDKYIFYFEDGKHFLRIYDKRDIQNIRIFDLNEIERRIFLACTNIISLQEFQEKFFDIPDFQLLAILHSFEQKGIVYEEDDLYINLPINIMQNNLCATRKKSQSILYNSGMQRTL